MDITSLGEILIDLTQTGVNEHGVPLFAANPGGAPANVAVAASRLGASAAFVGKVGNDGFGAYLRGVLEQDRVECSGLHTGDAATTMAVVTVDESGERSFRFVRGADRDLSPAEAEGASTGAKLLHFGSVSLTEDPARSATLAAVRAAREAGVLVSYDPNYRPAIWCGKEEQAAEILRRGLALADIVKVSDEEAELLTGERDCARAANCLAQGGVKYAFVTAGNRGCWYAAGGHSGYVPAFSVETVDTTGAGDSFMGAALHCLLSLPEEELLRPGAEMLEKTVRFASAAGALCTTGYGSIASMPGERQIRQLLDAKS